MNKTNSFPVMIYAHLSLNHRTFGTLYVDEPMVYYAYSPERKLLRIAESFLLVINNQKESCISFSLTYQRSYFKLSLCYSALTFSSMVFFRKDMRCMFKLWELFLYVCLKKACKECVICRSELI